MAPKDPEASRRSGASSGRQREQTNPLPPFLGRRVSDGVMSST